MPLIIIFDTKTVFVSCICSGCAIAHAARHWLLIADTWVLTGEICGGLSGCAVCFCLSKIEMHSHSNFDDGDEILKSSLKTEYQNHIFAVYFFQL
jgi:hypothetical protein